MAAKSTNNGPFLRRVRYEAKHVEKLCCDALRSVDLLPDRPGPIRIDRFVEKYFRLKLRYCRLDPGLMGAVQFDETGAVVSMMLCEVLGADTTLVGRRKCRSTTAHECGHGLLHGELFAERIVADRQQGMLRAESGEFRSVTSTGFLCRGEGDLGSTPKYEWWEFQANMAMAALLLPWNLVTEAAKPFASAYADAPLRGREAVTEQAADALADVFDVNPVMIRFRLKDWWKESLQLSLL